MESNNSTTSIAPDLATALGEQIKNGVIDSWRVDWLERNPGRLKSMRYKGKKVWYSDSVHDFGTAREAIDHGIRIDTEESL